MSMIPFASRESSLAAKYLSITPPVTRIEVIGQKPVSTLLNVLSGSGATAHESEVNCISISSDGNFIASCSDDKSVRVWNLETGRVVLGPLLHPSFVWTVAFAHAKKELVSGDDDGTLVFWSSETGKKVSC